MSSHTSSAAQAGVPTKMIEQVPVISLCLWMAAVLGVPALVLLGIALLDPQYKVLILRVPPRGADCGPVLEEPDRVSAAGGGPSGTTAIAGEDGDDARIPVAVGR